MKSIVICASIAGLLSAAANGADITWGTPTNIAGTSDVITSGTLLGTWAPGDDWGGTDRSDYYPVNGVTFAAYGTSGVNFGISGSGINMDRYNGFANPNTGDSNYNLLLQTAEFNWNSSSSSIIVSWSNLIAGDTYLVEAWLNDGRSGQSATSTFTGGANTSAPVAIGNGVPGQFITGTFVADSSGSQSFTMAPGIMLNLIQVRNITPTPSVTWGAPTPISGPADVETNGVYFGSWAADNQDAANNGSSGLVVNGTKFVATSDLPNFFTVGFNASYTGYNNPNTSDANYNDLLQSAEYEGNGDGRPVSLSWTGMAPGHTYQVQIWANDGRGNSRTENFTGGTNESATLDFGDAPGEVITGTFVADISGRQIISLSGIGSPNGDYPQVNLVQVRDITPTPNITWQTPVTISGTSDVSTQGTYFGSWAPYDGSANSYPVNGVTFQGFSDLPNFTSIDLDNGYNGFGNPGTPDPDYDILLQTATFANETPSSLTWNGMTPGHSYLVELWVNDGRNIGQTRSETFTGGTNTSSQVLYGSDGSGPGQYIIGTFVANATGAAIISINPYSSGANPDAQLNLLQVRDITVTPPQITSFSLSGTTLNLSATNGAANGQFVLLGSTTLTLPFSQWTPILTNNFDGNGDLNLSTNIINSSVKQEFFILAE